MGMAEIKELRARTGAGILDCKKALGESNNDISDAIDWLRTKGISKAAKKAGRAATEGLVEAYIHAGGKIGVLLEINSETDFVARNDQFKTLVRDVAMHIAAAAPEYVSRAQVPEEIIAAERKVQLARIIEEGKPEHIAGKIVEGRLNKFYQDICLLEQKFVKDDKITIEEMMTAAVARIGENINIRRFSRFVLGEGLEKKSENFAEEIASMTAANS